MGLDDTTTGVGTADERSEAVLRFWFGDKPYRAETMAARRRLWFQPGRDEDEQIRARFGDDVERVSANPPDTVGMTPRMTLASIILLDQFRRCLYRGSAAAFARDDAALSLALGGLDHGLVESLEPVERAFFCMPLQHAESLQVQDRAVDVFAALAAAVPAEWDEMFDGFARYAKLHRDIVARFGRFPHRNKVLGRTDTPEESEYLAGDAPRFGQ